MNSSVFNDFLSSAKDVEERTASGKLFQTEVAAAEKHLPPMVARQVRVIRTTMSAKFMKYPHPHWFIRVGSVISRVGSGRVKN